MERFIITGRKPLHGTVKVSGAKNVALKALVAACLTDEEVVIRNVPLISDLQVMIDIIHDLGGSVSLMDHTAVVRMKDITKTKIALDKAAEIRTSSMFIAPLLARKKGAVIPNPGGCRLGARPIDRIIAGLSHLGAESSYNHDDGYFYAKTDGLRGGRYRFEKNTHTGTETLILAAVLADGQTILENAALEPEVDELIDILVSMGARVHREEGRRIVIDGVAKLHGTSCQIKPDRNEMVTFACAAVLTDGDVIVRGAKKQEIADFLVKLELAGGGVEVLDTGIRFFAKDRLRNVDITTAVYPGFMTDWQGPWAVLMTKADGTSVIHETVFENRFGYVAELRKMGAKISFFTPPVDDPKTVYNFNHEDDDPSYVHAIKITGPRDLHNAVVTISDLRAGATLVLSALAAKGESVVFGVEHLDRGYERFDERLRLLGANIVRVSEEKFI